MVDGAYQKFLPPAQLAAHAVAQPLVIII